MKTIDKTQGIRKKNRPFRAVLSGFLLLAGCVSPLCSCNPEQTDGAKRAAEGANAVTIKFVLTNPAAFEKTEATIKGEVVSSTSIPFFRNCYTLKDATGEITVHRPNGLAVPTQGAKIVATGKVNQKFVIADINHTILEETEKNTAENEK